MLKAVKRSVAGTAARFGYHFGIAPPLTDSFAGHLEVVLDHLDVNLVLDVGANIGAYGRTVRAAGYAGRIASFEPDPDSAARLSEAAAQNTEWQVHKLALGAANGTATLRRFRRSVLNSLHEPSATGRALRGSDFDVQTTAEVDVRRLADVWPEVAAGLGPVRALLKIDTQGHDAQVLEGARPVLTHVVAIQTEVAWQSLYEGAPPWAEAIPALEAFGYHVSAIFPVSFDNDLRLTTVDCFLVRSVHAPGAEM